MNNVIKSFKYEIIFFVAILLAALFFRTYNLNSLPVFADEAIYVRWSQVMKAEPTLRFVPLSDGKPPLFMWSVIPFLKFISDPLIAGRLVSVIAGIVSTLGVLALSIVLFGEIGKIGGIREIGKQIQENRKAIRIGLLTSLIYALSPFSVFFDRLALADSMLSMFGIWFLVFSILTVSFLRLDLAMIFGFLVGGALLTKSPALFFVIMLPSTLLFLKKEKRKALNFTKVIFLWSVALIIGYAIYNVLRLGPNFGMLSSRNLDYVYPITHIFERPLDPFLPFVDRSFEWIMMLGPGSIVVFLVFSLFANTRHYFKQIAILLVWFLVPILIQSEYAKVLTARYIYFAIPYLYILGASAFLPFMGEIGDTGYWGDRKILKNFMLIGFTILIIKAIQVDHLLLTNPEAAPLPRSERSGYLEEWTAGTGIKESADFIRQFYLDNPDQKIVVGTEGYFGTLPDGMQIYLNDLPLITVIGVGLDFTKIPSSLVESSDAGNTTFLAVNSSRFRHNEDEFDKLGLKIVKKFKKADRPDKIREYVQHGQYDYFYLLELK